ncbi:type II toxin-antitoxin system VapC family toxin [Geotalea uraniireducens]|uniref:PilT protein domain protein n=1 Tax=Geotalea uraniireducens (strain Rf4) TaxID=351605 RepID=A5GB96_GEOUR|nr:PIN domain-containing protein [Geotalea uraniireducens]ABQ25152.1 PilT protein domain protein [Geotalea uraniireducens Rf4]
MKILVDTSVWSLALRRNLPDDGPEVTELIELIKEVRVQMIGPVRQELLSGVKNQAQFQKLRNHLRTFPDLELTTRDYETAAEFFNLCRGKGIQGSNTDFLICAIAARHKIPIFTTDGDFTLFQTHLPIMLHRPRS